MRMLRQPGPVGSPAAVCRTVTMAVMVATPAALGLLIGSANLLAGSGGQQKEDDEDRPKLELKASPKTGFAPTRVTLRGQLTGGPDDYEEFYCPTVEWDWGNDTTSEQTYDCDPWEAGKTEIKRRFTTQYVYNNPGTYTVRLILKKRGETVVAANTRVQVRPGMRSR